jgi:hypothetical protein
MNTNLIETINLLRKNKRYFGSNEDYLKILTNLYNEISDKNSSDQNLNFKELHDNIKNIKLHDLDQDEKKKIFDEILSSFNFDSILKIKNINKLVFVNPLFELVFVENNLTQFVPDKKFQIQSEPIFDPYNKQDIIDLVKVLLEMCYKANGYKNKTILCIIIFDIIFKNFQFVIDNNKFAITVKNKLIELKKDIDKIDEVCLKYQLEKDFLDKWIEVFNGIFES